MGLPIARGQGCAHNHDGRNARHARSVTRSDMAHRLPYKQSPYLRDEMDPFDLAVLEMLEQGCSNAEIRNRLGCSHQRVSGRLRALRGMSGVSTAELPTMFLWDKDVPWTIHVNIR